MSVIALLSVAPVIEESMASHVADAVAALDEFPVSYETNPMGTVIEADDTETLFAAAQAAHDAVDADRVSTVLKIDDKRARETTAQEKVDAVEENLGRPAQSGITSPTEESKTKAETND
ncbi:MTH1187 family thiamine-binding protein [Haloquadratum walsbyi]|nr:MTH1187 family thiamine-binding protein [Haloquadratum walsbyi]